MKKDNFLHDQRFQLLYLALLTSRKVKPLSRWEKSLGYREKQTLKKFDLVLEPVTRFCDNGKKIDEFVFSTSSRYLSAYNKIASAACLTCQSEKRISVSMVSR